MLYSSTEQTYGPSIHYFDELEHHIRLKKNQQQNKPTYHQFTNLMNLNTTYPIKKI